MEQKRLRLLIIIGFVVMAAIIVGVIALIINGNNTNTNEPTQTSYTDPVSGETILDTEGKTPERYGVNANKPNFLGFYHLLDRGMLEADVEDVKGFINDYADKQLEEGKEKVTEVSLDVDTIGHDIKRDTHEEIFTLNLVFNRERQYQLTITSNADTSKRTFSLIQNDQTVYTQTKDL